MDQRDSPGHRSGEFLSELRLGLQAVSVQAGLLAHVKGAAMYIEMVIAEMCDRQSLMEYEKLFLEEIGPTLTALPRVQSAHVAAKNDRCFSSSWSSGLPSRLPKNGVRSRDIGRL